MKKKKQAKDSWPRCGASSHFVVKFIHFFAFYDKKFLTSTAGTRFFSKRETGANSWVRIWRSLICVLTAVIQIVSRICLIICREMEKASNAPRKLRSIISGLILFTALSIPNILIYYWKPGGETGADQAGLEAAVDLGLTTGGKF